MDKKIRGISNAPRPIQLGLDNRRVHQASPAIANQLNDFVPSRQSTRLLLGIDSLLVNENVERAWPAQADASGNLQVGFDALFQAHGPRLDVASKEQRLMSIVMSALLQILSLQLAGKVAGNGRDDRQMSERDTGRVKMMPTLTIAEVVRERRSMQRQDGQNSYRYTRYRPVSGYRVYRSHHHESRASLRGQSRLDS
jgi:hypothetical protein